MSDTADIKWIEPYEGFAYEEDGTWKAVCLAKGEKVATEARINHMLSS